MLNTVAEFLKENNLENKTIIVGFSGGFDSMCLVDILSKIKERPEFFEMKVITAHLNHNWRGEESRKEQEICRIFSNSRSFEFYTKTAEKPIKKSENEARILRYQFFEEALDDLDADCVLTAHNKDDNAETILYRVIKGTGLVGLKGIAQRRDFYYRPLLNISRKEILEYCEKNNLTPNQDSSNSDTTFNRNYIRLNIIPALYKINSNVIESLNTLSEIAESEDEIIEEYLELIKSKLIVNEKILPSVYKTLSKPVKMRFIYSFIQNLNLDYDLKKVKEIYDFIEKNITQKNGSTISLATALWLYADEKTIEIIPTQKFTTCKFNIQIDKCGEYEFAGRKFILKRYEEKNDFNFPESTANFAYVDLSDIEFPLYIRTRKEGDMINPFGMAGSMKLKKFLNSKSIPRHKRDEIILLADNNEVLWAANIGISNKIKVKNKPTHVIEIV